MAVCHLCVDLSVDAAALQSRTTTHRACVTECDLVWPAIGVTHTRMLSSRRRPLPPRAAHRAYSLNRNSENWRTRLLELRQNDGDSVVVDIPHGVPIETATLAPCRPEDGGASAFYWQAVMLNDRSTILAMQTEDKWEVGAMVAPHFLHVWLRQKKHPHTEEDRMTKADCEV